MCLLIAIIRCWGGMLSVSASTSQRKHASRQWSPWLWPCPTVAAYCIIRVAEHKGCLIQLYSGTPPNLYADYGGGVSEQVDITPCDFGIWTHDQHLRKNFSEEVKLGRRTLKNENRDNSNPMAPGLTSSDFFPICWSWVQIWSDIYLLPAPMLLTRRISPSARLPRVPAKTTIGAMGCFMDYTHGGNQYLYG